MNFTVSYPESLPNSLQNNKYKSTSNQSLLKTVGVFSTNRSFTDQIPDNLSDLSEPFLKLTHKLESIVSSDSEMKIDEYRVQLNYEELSFLRSKFIKYCMQCEAVKLPRAHHCRQCDRCIMRMDHHCPWVGTCIGYTNYKQFLLFNFYVLMLTMATMGDLLARGIYCGIIKDDSCIFNSQVVDRDALTGTSIVLITSIFFLSILFGIFSLSMLTVTLRMIRNNTSTIDKK